MRIDGRVAHDILYQYGAPLVRAAVPDLLVLYEQRFLLLCVVDGTPF
jgi:hypothetical protein